MNWYMLCKKLGERGDVALPSFFVLFLPPAFVNIIAVFTLRAAKLGVGAAGSKNLVAMLTGFQGTVRIRQHKAEHHLQAQQ